MQPAVSVEGVETGLGKDKDHVSANKMGEMLEVYGELSLDGDFLIGTLLLIASLEVKEAPTGNLLVTSIHEFHRHRLPCHCTPRKAVELCLMDK